MEERSEIIEEYKKKIESLKKHNNFYYIKDKPKIFAYFLASFSKPR